MKTIDPSSLEYSWTAEVELNNRKTVIIWYTCWPMIKQFVDEIIWIASDYPKHKKS
jgi:hypothetical protein